MSSESLKRKAPDDPSTESEPEAKVLRITAPQNPAEGSKGPKPGQRPQASRILPNSICSRWLRLSNELAALVQDTRDAIAKGRSRSHTTLYV